MLIAAYFECCYGEHTRLGLSEGDNDLPSRGMGPARVSTTPMQAPPDECVGQCFL